MSSTGRRGGNRSKPRRKANRYNPNAPSWAAVHAPGIVPGILTTAPVSGIILAAAMAGRARRRKT